MWEEWTRPLDTVDATGVSSQDGLPRPRRRGRREKEAGAAPVAQELRRRRQALGLTVRQAAERAHVTAAMVSEIETGRRVPSIAAWARLRQSLGIEAPLAVLLRSEPPTEALEIHLVRLAACLVGSGGRVQLPDLGAAPGLPAAAVREQLPLVAPRLAACGLGMLSDGLKVRVEPLACCEPPLDVLGALVNERRRRALSEEAVIVLAYIGWHGEATRREIERFRGEDSETLLGRLLDADLLAAVRDDAQLGRPNRYRLSVAGLRMLGAASAEELRQKLQPTLGALVGEGEGVVPLGDQLTVLTLVAGVGEAGPDLIARGLRTRPERCTSLLQHLEEQGLLVAIAGPVTPTYRLGPAGAAVLGADGAAAVRRVAERAELPQPQARLAASPTHDAD